MVKDHFEGSEAFLLDHFQIQTVNSCNGCCIMCPYTYQEKRRLEVMSNDIFEKTIREIAEISRQNNKSIEVTLMLQNEPFMDKRIVEQILFAKKFKNLHVTTATNASLLNEDVIKRLERSGIDSLTVSIDSVNRKTFESIRPCLDFEKVMGNIGLLRGSSLKDRVKVRMILQKKNFSEADSFARFWLEKGISVEIRAPTNRGSTLPNFESLKVDAVLSPEAQRFFKGYDTWDSDDSKKGFCSQLFHKFNILSNGDVIKCCHDWEHKDVAGNVRKSSITEIWDSKFKEYRDLFLAGRCRSVYPCNKCSLVSNA